MENFKDLKTYILNKKENLVEYIREKRNVLTNSVNKVVSLGDGFIKNNSKKFAKGAAALGLAGVMLFSATGCGVKVNNQTGEITSFGHHVGYADKAQNNEKPNSGYTDPNKCVDGAVIEVVEPNKNNQSGNPVSGNNNAYNDGAIIEDVSGKNNSSSNNTSSSNCNDGAEIEAVTPNTESVSTEKETEKTEEWVDDGAIIEIVDSSCGNSQVIGSQDNSSNWEESAEEETEQVYDDIIIVDGNGCEESPCETEEMIDDGAIIEIVG